MTDFENQIDEIRIKLYDETKNMDKVGVISTVNSHARKIAQEFGINVKSVEEEYFETVDLQA
ncbi:MAG: hypothetical protein FWG29_06380 [Treponema sp.]|nr:hypothetical protein [Treponema sp.]